MVTDVTIYPGVYIVPAGMSVAILVLFRSLHLWGAPVAMWVKRWPTDLVFPSSNPV